MGWADIPDLIEKMTAAGLPIDFDTLKHIVDTSEKKRFTFNLELTKVRANQGHSIEIEHGFEAKKPPEILYHGTGQKSLASIRETGIDKRKRHHVHLSADQETALTVGQRHGNPVILKIMAMQMKEKGHIFYLSENHVWLTDFVPAEFICF